MSKLFLALWLSSYFYDSIQTKSNQQIFFEEVKNYRTEPELLRDKLQLYWVPNLDERMLNNTLIFDNGKEDIKNLMLYLDNKEILKFDRLRLDKNLSKIAKFQSDHMVQHNKLSYTQNKQSLDDRIYKKGSYSGNIVEIVFKFSKKLTKLSNVFLNMLIQNGNPNKKNREIFNMESMQHIGIGFSKRKNFIYSSVILAEKYICFTHCE